MGPGILVPVHFLLSASSPSPCCNQATARGHGAVTTLTYLSSKPLPGLPGCLNASNLLAGWGQSPEGFLGQGKWKKSFGVVWRCQGNVQLEVM